MLPIWAILIGTFVQEVLRAAFKRPVFLVAFRVLNAEGMFEACLSLNKIKVGMAVGGPIAVEHGGYYFVCYGSDFLSNKSTTLTQIQASTVNKRP